MHRYSQYASAPNLPKLQGKEPCYSKTWPRLVCRLVFLVLCLFYSCSASAHDVVFPLHVAADGRHLEDAAGHPFLITGDAAWSMIAQLSREDVDIYLADRKRRGFNTLLVSLIEHDFSRNAPKNVYGNAPFLHGKTFAAPNDAYFAHAEWILRRAREMGFLVLLTPAYLGINGGDEGWYQDMKKAGDRTLRSYGQYVGRRFGGLGNIMWIEGGDYDPVDKSLVQSVAEGIRETAPDNLQSFHGAPESAPRHFWDEQDWLSVDTVYTYRNVAVAGLDHYTMRPAMPFFLIESRYEGEGANEFDIRRIAYSALLSGACGQIFGNNPIWHFDGPGLYPTSLTWKEALSSRGAQSISHMHSLFDRLEWWKLRPDAAVEVVNPAPGEGGVVSASAADGSLVLAYLWDTPDVTLHEDKAASFVGQAQWFDPSSGIFQAATGEKTATGDLSFRVPAATNAAGFSDWVLLISGRR